MKEKPSKYHNQDPLYYKYREFVVGLFILIPMILIPFIIAVVVISSDWTKKKFTLHFTHTLNAQVIEGNEVFILSKQVGHVKDVKLNPLGHVDVMIRIEDEYRPLIRKDARIRMKQKNLVMGDWQMELILGDCSQQMVEDGDTLAIIPPLDLQQLSDEVIEITKLMNEILDTVAHGNGIVSNLLNGDSTIDNSIESTVGSIKTALNSLNDVLQNGNRLLNSGNHMMDSVVAVRVPEVFDNVDGVLMVLDSVLMDVNKLLDDSDSIPMELRNTLQHLNRDLDEGEVLIKALQKHWILRKEVEKVRSSE